MYPAGDCWAGGVGSLGSLAMACCASLQVRAALFDPPPFSPKKLRVEYLPGAETERRLTARRYTLTHNDLTGALTLSIGAPACQRY